MTEFCKILSRRKPLVVDDDSELKRTLTLLDLIFLGVGSTLGLGVYVLAGEVAYNVAGPGVIISFLFAGIASFIAAVCYGEFAARVPQAGSAYAYTYVSIGEFIAFSIGWNMVLEYIIGTASLARGLSSYMDTVLYGEMSRVMTAVLPLNVPYFAQYPDFLSFGIVILLTVLLAIGMKESSTFNIFCTVLNLLTIMVVIIAGSIFADVKNWEIPKDEIPDNFGNGGFLPFGLAGVMKGAATCFYGFVGFDGIGTTAEEALNPRRNLPLSIMLSFIIVLLAYLGISIVLTLMLPYYKQSPTAPFPVAFGSIHCDIVKWIVTIGALFALTTSLLGAMFPLPRIIYAMAMDGVIFKWLASVNSNTKTPVKATIIAGIIASFMALLFDLKQLVDMMSIGTLMAYTIVAVCIVVLRYQDENMEFPKSTSFLQLFNCNTKSEPNVLTSLITNVCLLLFVLFSVAWCTILLFFELDSQTGIIVSSVIAFVSVLVLIIIALQPISKVKLSFRVPLVPILPAVSVVANIYLMYQLSADTWIRFIVWITIGYLIYFLYGTRNSNLRMPRNEKEKTPPK